MKQEDYGTPFKMKKIDLPVFPTYILYARDFMDKDIGKEPNGHAIQKAIEECSKKGGGTVVVTEGIWHTGPIHLKSNIHLKLEKSAVLQFSDRFSDYLPVVFTRWEGMECYNYSPLIYAKDCENIAITGEGTLIGSGEAWWSWKKLQQQAANELCYAESRGISVKDRIFGTTEAALRPSFIQTINCKQIYLQGFTVKNGPQ